VFRGAGFLLVTGADFNGATADGFRIIDDPTLTAIVPAGATTGPVHVTTASRRTAGPVFTILGADDMGLTDVETFRLPGYTDAQTIQAALDSGKPLSFQQRTYVINAGETVINTSCHLMVGYNVTLMIGNGAIVNTDASPFNHTAFMRMQGVQGLLMIGRWNIDGNRDNQTYPATVNAFGRGGAVNAGGDRTNGIIEFTPGADNVTPCRHLRIEGIDVKNAYTNGLVFWQCEDAVISNCYSHDNRISGIAGAGLTDFYVTESHHFRDGWSDTVNTTRYSGDAAGVQIREVPADLSAGTLGMPSIPTPIAGQAAVNYNVQVTDSSADSCGVESWFLRACFPGVLSNLVSRNVGYKRLTGAALNAVHFVGDGGWWIWNDLAAHQPTDNVPSGWQRPNVATFGVFDGLGAGASWGINGTYPSSARNVSGLCGLTAAGAKQTNFNRGLVVSEQADVDGVALEGLSAEAAVVVNLGRFNSRPPNSVTLRNWHVSNVDCTRLVWFQKTGTVTGQASGLTVDGLMATDIRSALAGASDHCIIEVDASLATFDQHDLTLVNLDIDCLNTTSGAAGGASGSFCGVRLRNPQSTKNIRVDFVRCLNAFSPVLATGFADLVVTGRIDTASRVLLVDHVASTANSGSLVVSVTASGIVSELFVFQNMGTFKMSVVRVENCNFAGAAGCRTFPAGAGGITTAPGSFFAEALKYFWRGNVDAYGSSNPAVNVYDMRRTFSTFANMSLATPYYNGELVVEADDSSNWMGLTKNSAATWSLLSSP
jgi:hypothetical protein